MESKRLLRGPVQQGGSNVSEGSRRRWGRGPRRTRGGKTGGGDQGRTRRSRRERTPPDLTMAAAAAAAEEEREQEEQRQEEEEAGDTRAVWLRGPSQLPQRPIPLARRQIIRPVPDR